MKYSILVVAIDCHYSHITRFVCNLKQENPDVEIHYLTEIKKDEIPEEIVNNVAEIINFKVSNGKGGYYGIFKKILDLRKQFKKLSKKHKYYVVDIHFTNYYMAVAMPYLRNMSSNIVVSPWGSDVLRIEGFRFKVLLKCVFAKCDYITTAIDGNVGKRILEYLPSCREKFYPQAWGSETIDYIVHHLSETDTATAKERFGLEGKYVITCGYNAFRAQNHDKIIDAIAGKRSQLPENLKLLIPVSYGAYDKDKYVAELKKKCQEAKIDALFVEEYMSVEDVFLLRMATDMFVHTQNTDAGCASLQEYVLCDKKIVHGSWIHYPKLDVYSPLCYYTASDFSVLGDVIVDTYHAEPILFSQEVLDYIRSNGWEVRRKEWNDMFEKIVTSNRRE